jgi:hypothetical protein
MFSISHNFLLSIMKHSFDCDVAMFHDRGSLWLRGGPSCFAMGVRALMICLFVPPVSLRHPSPYTTHLLTSPIYSHHPSPHTTHLHPPHCPLAFRPLPPSTPPPKLTPQPSSSSPHKSAHPQSSPQIPTYTSPTDHRY